MKKEQFEVPTLEVFTFDAQDAILTASSITPPEYIIQYNDYAANALHNALGVDSVVREN
ncbi:MAG: hypothetical protein ACI4I5_03490 [Acutalibacteraceae bacterium]